MDRNIKLNYSSTLEGSVLTLTCENEILSMNTTGPGEEILSVTCHSNRSWIPSQADFIKKSCLPFSTTVSPTPGILAIFVDVLTNTIGILLLAYSNI